MKANGRSLGAAAGVLLVAVLVRGPLHVATYAVPVSNDDAVPLLIAGRLLHGEATTTLWNQPYNGTLDAWLLAPWLALAPSHATFRAYEGVCGALLVLLAAALAGRVGGGSAAWTAGGLAACGPPYMDLMAATGPVPNFVMPLVTGIPLWAALRHVRGAASTSGGGAPKAWASLACGAACGLAVWNSALAVPALAGIGAGLLLAGWRPRRGVVAFAAGLAVGLAPLLIARVVGASGSSTVTAVRPAWLWADGMSDLASAAAGLLGLEVPQVVDGPERDALALGLRLALGIGLVTLVALGAAAGRRAWPLLGWAAALAGAFAMSRRTDANEVRYLFGLLVPILALGGVGLARLARSSRLAAGLAALAVLAPWIQGHRLLAARWREPNHAARVWQVPDLVPVLDTLARARVVSAYASLQFAGRLALESEGRLVASQAFNERVPGDPLRFRDEVDLDPDAAWVLSPHLSRGMPRAGGFRELLGGMRGAWKEDLPGQLVVFRRFEAPFEERRAVPRSALRVSSAAGEDLGTGVLDRDAATGWTSASGLAPGRGVVVALDEPRRVSALVFVVALDPSPLAVPWVVTADGRVVAQGPRSYGLQWVNGGPRMGRQALLVADFPPVRAGDLRLLFQGEGAPLGVREAFVYGPDEELADDPAGEAVARRALDRARSGDWPAAEALYAEAARIEPERASWHAGRLRAAWRASGRRWLDVESLGDGGEEWVRRR